MFLSAVRFVFPALPLNVFFPDNTKKELLLSNAHDLLQLWMRQSCLITSVLASLHLVRTKQDQPLSSDANAIRVKGTQSMKQHKQRYVRYNFKYICT